MILKNLRKFGDLNELDEFLKWANINIRSGDQLKTINYWISEWRYLNPIKKLRKFGDLNELDEFLEWANINIRSGDQLKTIDYWISEWRYRNPRKKQP